MYANYKANLKADNKASNAERAKTAAITSLRRSLSRYINPENSQNSQNSAPISKKSNSILQYLEVPHSSKPVAAGDENVKPKGGAKGNKGESLTRPKLSPGALFNIKDAAIKSIVCELGELFAKHAVAIRLGKNYEHYRKGPPTQKNVGIDLNKMQAGIAALKQQRLFSANPLPMGAQAQPAPVASYPGMNSAPQPAQQAPRTAANKPAQQSAASNPIGLKGPLNTKDGVPTFAQNLTGNASFGKGTA